MTYGKLCCARFAKFVRCLSQINLWPPIRRWHTDAVLIGRWNERTGEEHANNIFPSSHKGCIEEIAWQKRVSFLSY